MSDSFEYFTHSFYPLEYRATPDRSVIENRLSTVPGAWVPSTFQYSGRFDRAVETGELVKVSNDS